MLQNVRVQLYNLLKKIYSLILDVVERRLLLAFVSLICAKTEWDGYLDIGDKTKPWIRVMTEQVIAGLLKRLEQLCYGQTVTIPN
jgi:hypothetical protein